MVKVECLPSQVKFLIPLNQFINAYILNEKVKKYAFSFILILYGPTRFRNSGISSFVP